MRRNARAAFATDQAARKPARMMSASFQASLDLGLRRGSIGGMALRTKMTATTMPIADATTAGSGAVKGNMTVWTSDRVIKAPRRHNPRRQETKRATKFAWPKREGYFVSRVPRNRDRFQGTETFQCRRYAIPPHRPDGTTKLGKDRSRHRKRDRASMPVDRGAPICRPSRVARTTYRDNIPTPGSPFGRSSTRRKLGDPQ
jgi:hypothetical protein